MSSQRTRRTRLAPPESIGALRRQRLDWARLYFVCNAQPGGVDPEGLIRAALTGGAGIVQLREKDGGAGQIHRAAQTFRRLADTYGAPFIVNDDPQLAKELDADGVHLGQDDFDPAEARSVLGEDAIIGLSTHSEEQIETAAAAGIADYISVGPVWETPTKAGRPAVGLELIRHAADRAAAGELPFFAIGGIDLGNIGEVLEAGATRVCVVRAIRDAEDPMAAAESLRAAIGAGKRDPA